MVKTLEHCAIIIEVMWSPDAGPPPDNLVSAIRESKLLVQTSAGRLMQGGEEQGDAEKDGDFSDLEHEEVCDDELADSEAMRGLGAGPPTRRPPRRGQMKNSRKLESDLNEVASGRGRGNLAGGAQTGNAVASLASSLRVICDDRPRGCGWRALTRRVGTQAKNW